MALREEEVACVFWVESISVSFLAAGGRGDEAPGGGAGLCELLVVDVQVAEATRLDDADERAPEQRDRDVDGRTAAAIVQALAGEPERCEHGQLEGAALGVEILDVILQLE